MQKVTKKNLNHNLTNIINNHLNNKWIRFKKKIDIYFVK